MQERETEILQQAEKDGKRQECEVWTRVMGYHRPTHQYNIGKKAEHEERVFFTEK